MLSGDCLLYAEAPVTGLLGGPFWVGAFHCGLLSNGLCVTILSAPQDEVVNLLCRSNSLAPPLPLLPLLRSCRIHGNTEVPNGCGGATLPCVRTSLSTSHVSIWTAHQRDNER